MLLTTHMDILDNMDFSKVLSPFADINIQSSLIQQQDDNINEDISHKCKNSKIDNLRHALDKIAEEYSHEFTQRKFKAEAGQAWARNNTEPVRVSPYQAFIKRHICEVRSTNPTLSHQEHMRIIGRQWNEEKVQNDKTRFYKESLSLSGIKRQATNELVNNKQSTNELVSS